MIDRYLSIWEIAHRWHDVNPDTSDPANLPLNVQDTIRYICRGILNSRISIFDIVVMRSKDEPDNPDPRLMQFSLGNPPDAIENCLYRQYDKETLNSQFIDCDSLFYYCVESQGSDGKSLTLDFPACWTDLISAFDSSEIAPDHSTPAQNNSQSSPLRLFATHKLICQAIAQTLWDAHPDMTIAAMTKHSAILEYGSGKFYMGKNTLREWISKVAPENKRKPGRPKNSKPNNDAD